MDRRTFLAALPLLFASETLSRLAPERKFSKIILITVDTLRPDHLGCYGSPLKTSPNLDAFASSCLRFERAFAPCSFTRPSVVSMLASRWPGLTPGQFLNFHRDVKHPDTMIQDCLRKKGLKTAAFVGNFVLKSGNDVTNGFDSYDATLDAGETNRTFTERICSSLTPAATRWLEKNHSKPFFLWLHYQDPHGPYTPPEPYSSRFTRNNLPPRPLELADNNGGLNGIPPYQELPGHRDLNHYLAQYNGEIAFDDHSFGLFMETVKRLGLLDDTVLVFSSDHGESFGENNYYCCHGHFVSPELAHVPLLVHIPGLAPASCGVPVSLIDVAPTLASLAGASAPPTFLGENLLETASKGERTSPCIIETSYAMAAVSGNHFLLWGAPRPEAAKKTENVKVADPKSIDFFKAPISLSDISSDLSLRKDVSADNPRWLRYLRGVCQNHLRASAEFFSESTGRPIDDEAIKALRSLGYFD